MVRFTRGLVGVLSYGWCVVAALSIAGCGSSDDSSSGSTCGTILQPGNFKVANVTPARGATVPNTAIVESFTIQGQVFPFSPEFSADANTHTAGDSSPSSVTWTETTSASGKDSVFTSEPITWATAPGHVELSMGGVTTNPSTTCASQFQNPIFSYDVSAAP